MKKELVIFLVSIFAAINTFAQRSSMDVFVTSYNTNGGSHMEIAASQNGDDYDIKITCRYRYYGDDQWHSLVVGVPSYLIPKFKDELGLIYNKFRDWHEISVDNNVQEIEKELPIRLTAIGYIADDHFNKSINISTKTIYQAKRVQISDDKIGEVSDMIDDVSILEFHTNDGYGHCQTGKWFLNLTDFINLSFKIDEAIEQQRNYDKAKHDAEKLYE